MPEWQNRASWRILDCEFGFDARFFETLLAWQQDNHRPRMLHYVGVCSKWADLEPGFHRFSMAQGRVLFTLCVGEVQSQLKELSFAADSVCLDFSRSEASNWTRWKFKSLARCCRRGTVLTTTALTPEHRQELQAVGFEMHGSEGTFAPWWQVKAARQPWLKAISRPSSCIVLGAGLAGGSVAASLARRGWQVLVLDAENQPACGASSLPVGLVEPHSSADDSPRSRLSRVGVNLTLEQARNLLHEGTDWDHSGVMNVISQTWQPTAAWIKPARLVEAWLKQPGIAFVGNTRIVSLAFKEGSWMLLGESGHLLYKTEHLVLSCAMQTADFLQSLNLRVKTLEGVAGLVNWGWQDQALTRALPSQPVNGMGSLIPGVPQGKGQAWYVGATYRKNAAAGNDVPDLSGQQRENHDRLKALSAKAAHALQDLFNSEQPQQSGLQAWQGVRCVSQNRLPVVGGVLPGLWLSTAMGSRGLTFAALCAELLAAELCGEPMPVQASLARVLKPGRAVAQTR